MYPKQAGPLAHALDVCMMSYIFYYANHTRNILQPDDIIEAQNPINVLVEVPDEEQCQKANNNKKIINYQLSHHHRERDRRTGWKKEEIYLAIL